MTVEVVKFFLSLFSFFFFFFFTCTWSSKHDIVLDIMKWFRWRFLNYPLDMIFMLMTLCITHILL
jgi:hypothetical protein